MNIFDSVTKVCGLRLRGAFIGLLLCLCHPSALAEPRFQRLFTEAEAAVQGVGGLRALVQDQLGFIWLGGENGLARYDGVSLKRYQSDPSRPNSLSDSFVRDIQIDRDGVMWIATDFGVSRYNLETDDFTSFIQGDDSTSTSHNMVTALAVDQQNNLYIGTGNGLMVFDPTRTQTQHYYPQSAAAPDTGTNTIRDIFIDRQNRLWLGTADLGLVLFDLKTQQAQFFQHNKSDPRSIAADSILSIEEDALGRLWVGTSGGGVSRMDVASGTFTNYRHNPSDPTSIGSNTIWDIYADSGGTVWLATDPGGLAWYDPESDTFLHSRYSPYKNDSLSSNAVRVIFEDKQHDLWLGMFPQGVNYYSRAVSNFENYEHKPDDVNSLSNSAVLAFHEDKDGIIWIGTESGLDSFNPITKAITRHNAQPGVPGGLMASPVLAIKEDISGDLWLGTWSGGLYLFNKKTGLATNFMPDKDQPGTINSAYIWSLEIDKNNDLWIGTETGGLNQFDRRANRFNSYKPDPYNPDSINGKFVWDLKIDRADHFWVGTDKGLVSFDPTSGIFTRYEDRAVSEKKNNTIIRIRTLAEDRRGRIWVGTQDDGAFVYDPQTNLTVYLDETKGMPSRHVPSIVEDDLGNVWLTTGNGVVRVNAETFDMTVFRKGHGLIADSFNRDASLKDRNGNLYLGSSNGFSVFDPKTLNVAADKFSVLITDFRIFNRPVAVGAEDSPLVCSILTTEEITLDHSHSVFSFEFSALSYQFSARNHYAYKLEGFDKDWNLSGTDRTATYTNIGAGKYIFKVKGINGDGVWSENIAIKKVIVLPPPWKTWWAYALYVALMILFITAMIRTKARKMALENQKSLNAELLRVNKIKDAFLANTSHELRTPLNGIIGIAESMADNPIIRSSADLFRRLNLIVFSGKRLSSLINDILDYSKLCDRHLEIFCTSVDLKTLVDDVFQLLGPLSEDKKIGLENAIDPSFPPVHADENRLLQILINLVGNGIKYSDAGTVRVSCRQRQNCAEIIVEDNGVGIAEDQFEHIFEAFVQLESSDSRRYGGTGLGLSVCKQLVELHDGKIWVESELGVGSRFIFTLRFREAGMEDFCHYETHRHTPPVTSAAAAAVALDDLGKDTSDKDGAVVNKLPLVRSDRGLAASVDDIGVPPAPANAASFTILIVDDDAVNRLVLSGTLALHKYHVIEAPGGREALEILARGTHVDLVILDVMMPHLNGYDTCELIRERYSMHELPIIFLTAKKVDEDIAKAFAAGGTELLTKPVSKYELLPRIANHLKLLEIFRSFR
jgi:two-component system, sensor histidine kinase ChiS